MIRKSRIRLVPASFTFIVILYILLSNVSGKCQIPAKKGNLKVIVNNMHSKNGQVGFFLFNSGNDFPTHTDKALSAGFIKIVGNTVEYTFTNLAAGTYAVYAFHDEDNNKELKTNFIGMPKEGMGVSNNAKGHFGPPNYDDAKFEFNKLEQTITISLTYL